MRRIYISGPMTGLLDLNFPAFHAAAAMPRQRGYDAVNPAEISAACGDDWHMCMRADIKALCDCDTLALMPGWQKSQAASNCTSLIAWGWRS